ncbi:MAG TPA: penicillin acylase family protein [Vicinamibacterales bacterium]|nr:penicillin acylase family protein [Vicinamibacterales bacterium]
MSIAPVRLRITARVTLAVVVVAALAAARPTFAAPTHGTEILWDKWGIPHITAADHPSLFYAYGYAQMEAHSELLLRLYAQARGRGAEFYGEEYLEADRWVRVNGIPARAKEWARAQTPEFGPLIGSFVQGLNAWAQEHQADLSPAAKGVLPLTEDDVYAHCLRVIHYDWIINPAKLASRLARAAADVHGSNEWAIAPAYSASGKAMLLSNSHLQWGDMHTYFEVQLTAPGVTSYGAVWVGFPVLRQCFNDYLGWTQTTNNPSESDLYQLTLKDGGYVLDGVVKPFEVSKDVIRIRGANGVVREEPITIRRTVQGPVVAERNGMTIAMRVAAIDRPRLFEQFWRMGLAHNLDEWQAAMRMQQLPLFNTAYADRDGHIGYVYNSTLPVHPTGDYKYWQGVVPGDRSDLISSTIVPYDQIPKVFDPPTGWVQNSNDMPWTSVYPPMLDATRFAAGFAAPQGITQRAQRGIRILSGFTGRKMTFADVKAGKLSTRLETADQFVDDLVALARAQGTERARRAADVLEKWDRQAENTSDGMLLFYKFMLEARPDFGAIGGFAVPTDDRTPLTTPRGFKDPAKAVAALDKVAGAVEAEYGRLNVPWGDVMRFRRGNLDVPGNGAPSALGAIRTVNASPFVNGKVEGIAGDTYFAVIEFSTPVHAEALLSYGNWSRKGSPHVEDQMRLLSRKEMRPIWRDRKDVEANLEARKVF